MSFFDKKRYRKLSNNNIEMNKTNEFYVVSLESLILSRFYNQVNELLSSYNGKPITPEVHKKQKKSKTGEATLFFIYNVFDRDTKTDNVIGICRLHPLYANARMFKYLNLRFKKTIQTVSPSKKSLLYLSTFVIREAYRGNGNGKKLLSFLLWYVDNNSIIQKDQTMLLLVGKENANALSLYEKHGFKIIDGYDKSEEGPEHLMAFTV